MANTKYTELYKQLVDEASQERENKDCSVKAIAISCGVHYKDARKALANEGRKNGKGAYTHQILNAAKALGRTATKVDVRKFIDKYPGVHSNLKSITTHHPERFHDVWEDGKTYLAFTSNHVLAIVNGVNHDWTVTRQKRITALYVINQDKGE